ncbi:hypothetical protein RSAG8_00038, partial [Rhizoctonia solani AG-8 WAC10335]
MGKECVEVPKVVVGDYKRRQEAVVDPKVVELPFKGVWVRSKEGVDAGVGSNSRVQEPIEVTGLLGRVGRKSKVGERSHRLWLILIYKSIYCAGGHK